MKRKASRGGRTGFTLLEVLAAVAVLGIWFTVLASIAIHGLRAEGRNERHLRASLLADTTLARIEQGLRLNEFPDEFSESEAGDFRVEIETMLLQDVEIEEVENDLGILLTELVPRLAENLHMIEVRVIWTEGYDEYTATRTTYAWDNASFNALLEGSPGAAGEDALDEEPAGLEEGALDAGDGEIE